MVDREHTISTVEEFEAWVALPQNTDKHFEFIGGEIVEVAPSNTYASHVASRINRRLGNFVEPDELGYVTDGQGGFVIAGERYAPDVGYISKERQPELDETTYNPNPPELAVEVDFPSSLASRRKLHIKTTNYLVAGTTVWIVLPETQQVEVYVPGQPYQVLGIDDILTCEHILPGFQIPIKEIFPPRKK